MRLRARAQMKFKCEFVPLSSSSFSLFPSSFAPDIHNGIFWGDGENILKEEKENNNNFAWLSVGVQNQRKDKWLKNLILSLSSSEEVELVETNAGDFSIAPGNFFIFYF